jgi:tRNA A37 threonylcarbamoyltransferase TsaD
MLTLFVFASAIYKAQEVDLENLGKRTMEELKKNPFKISGGVSANSVFYSNVCI